MASITKLHGPRPVAVVPSSASYRTQPGRVVTVAGFADPAALAGFAPAAVAGREEGRLTPPSPSPARSRARSRAPRVPAPARSS